MAADEVQTGAPADHDLGAYLKAIRRRMPLILLLTGIVTAVAVVLSLAQTKEYEASARVVLSQTDPINNIIDTAQPVNYDPEAARNTLVALIKLEPVAEAVVAAEDLDYTPDEVLDKVTTEVESNSDIVLIKALDPGPGDGGGDRHRLRRAIPALPRGNGARAASRTPRMSRAQTSSG